MIDGMTAVLLWLGIQSEYPMAYFCLPHERICRVFYSRANREYLEAEATWRQFGGWALEQRYLEAWRLKRFWWEAWRVRGLWTTTANRFDGAVEIYRLTLRDK